MTAITFNSFLEDTCVLVAGAFLFVRGPMERLIAKGSWLGLLAGAFSASEAIFPGDRYPYAPHTLACAFATAIAGPGAGGIAGAVSILTSAVLLPRAITLVIAAQILLSVCAVGIVARLSQERWWCVPAFAISQVIGTKGAHFFLPNASPTLTSPTTMVANSFGLVLLLLVVRDARLRAESHRNLHEVDEARRIAAEAQLAIVRTRVQPHFLFNALNSIAALCMISPERAAEATANLGKLMRRSLEVDLAKGLSIREEMDIVANYIAVEKERFGSKLEVTYDIETFPEIEVPAFSIQILVENAVLHGLSTKVGAGKLRILARKSAGGATVAVIDDGVGIAYASRHRSTPHGLSILSDQLRSICGIGARLHVVRRDSGGTIAAFHVPEIKSPDRKRIR